MNCIFLLKLRHPIYRQSHPNALAIISFGNPWYRDWGSCLMHSNKSYQAAGLIHYSGPEIFVIGLGYPSNHYNMGTLAIFLTLYQFLRSTISPTYGLSFDTNIKSKREIPPCFDFYVVTHSYFSRPFLCAHASVQQKIIIIVNCKMVEFAESIIQNNGRGGRT